MFTTKRKTLAVMAMAKKVRHYDRRDLRLYFYGVLAIAVVIFLCNLIYMAWMMKRWDSFGNKPSSGGIRHLKLGKPFEKDRKYHVEITNSSTPQAAGLENAKFAIDKSKTYGLCVVGAGLSGTVFAERAANYLAQKVLMIDSRPHIGGNCYDTVDEQTGILRGQYGPHLFHTNIERVWDYVNNNAKTLKWKRFYQTQSGVVNGESYVPIPVNVQTVNLLLDKNMHSEEELKQWLQTVQIPCPQGKCESAEQMTKSIVGEDLYKLLFEDYIRKQFGKHPKELDASVMASISILDSTTTTTFGENFGDKYQALPAEGYTEWFASMLDHPLIDVVLKVDFFDHRQHLEQACDKIIYTGPIDRYFQQEEEMEKLEYRSIIFTEERHFNHPGNVLPTPVLNYPGLETEYTRAVEYKQYLHRPSNHSLVVKELYSADDDGHPYYPVPTERNRKLYEKYEKLAKEAEKSGKIQFVGGLANYKYYNMDQAIDNALTLFYQSSPLRSDFMNNEFQAYKATINKAMKAYQNTPASNKKKSSCPGPPQWNGEFGKELRVITPWAYYTRETCGSVTTKGVKGTKYLYYFSSQHIINPIKQRYGKTDLPKGNPFGSSDVHVKDIPTDRYRPPPYADFFRRSEMESLLDGKELVVILNKYSIEWGNLPYNYFSVETLRTMLDYLIPKYKVLYKRHTSSALLDVQGPDGDLNEKEMLRKEYPDVLLYEDFAEALEDVEDSNLLLFGFLSLSRKFLTTQGGNAVVGSYFGGTNIIYIKRGLELQYGDYGYFHRFSNATIIQTQTDKTFLEEMKKNM